MSRKTVLTYLSGVLIGIGLIGGAAYVNAIDQEGTVFERANKSVFQIVATKKDGEGGSSGTGFYINSTTAITACHVVDGFDTVYLGSYKAEVLTCNKESDIAILRTTPQQYFSRLKCSYVTPSMTQYFSIGYPFGGAQTVKLGVVTKKIDDNMYEYYSNIHMGDSGGPVFDKYGMVIGVTHATTIKGLGPIPIFTGRSFIIPTPTICKDFSTFIK